MELWHINITSIHHIVRVREVERCMRFKKKSCTRKMQFVDIAEAQAEADRLNRLHPSRVATYPCKLCGYFHVGHPTNASKRLHKTLLRHA